LLAAELKIGFATVARIWRKWNLQPWRVQTFQFSTDPELDSKIRDVVGLYLHPPEKAVVLFIDEKLQVQALNRTAPILPIMPGVPERQTHYVRNGTTTLFAALEVTTGRVEQTCLPRHRHQESNETFWERRWSQAYSERRRAPRHVAQPPARDCGPESHARQSARRRLRPRRRHPVARLPRIGG
jgi:hypothetical protein